MSKVYLGTALVANGIVPYSGPASPIMVIATEDLVAGINFPEDTLLSLCIQGGGGGGMSTTAGPNGGGYAGALTQDTITLPKGEVVTVTIGAGGAGVPADAAGGAGAETSFGTYFTALGGGGGNNGGHFGNSGGTVSPCDGVEYFDGAANVGYGGQASAFANGAAGTPDGQSSGAGTLGSGGGGTQGNYSGGGGAGVIMISWT